METFISQWSAFYSYKLEYLYDSSITKRQFEEADIQGLFKWKNGMNLSQGKQNSLDKKVLNRLMTINSLKDNRDVDVEAFREKFRDLSAVWKLFLLHTLKPNRYPIYDQHIHRAFHYLHGLNWQSINNVSLKDREKENFYFDHYLPFFSSLKDVQPKKLDEALFCFGRFLRSDWVGLLKGGSRIG